MLNSSVLEVAIGLVFLYLSMSLACSALAEYYSALMSRRAKHLRDSLFFLFNKDDPKGLAFLLDFYTHPLVSGLAPEKAQIASSPSKEIPIGLPWYQQMIVIVLRGVAELVGLVTNFVGTVLLAVRWIGSAIRDPYGVGGVVSGLKKDLAVAARATPSYIPDRAFADAIFAVLANDGSATRRIRIELNEKLTLLEQYFRALKHRPTADILTQQLTASSQSLRTSIEDSTAPEKAVSIAEEAFTALGDTLLPKDDFELRLMPSVSDANDIPKEGKALVIVGAVKKILHFRVFNSQGKVIADNDERSLPEQSQRIDALRKQLDPVWSSNALRKLTKRRVVAAVRSIVGSAPDELSYKGVSELLARYFASTGTTDAAPAPEHLATTGAPVTAMGAPVLNVVAATVETVAPVVESVAPVATTGASVGTKEAPIVETVAPIGATEASVATTEAPTATLEPVAATAGPVASTGAPVVMTGAPVVAIGAPVATPPARADAVRTAMIGEAGSLPEGTAKRELLALLGGTGALGFATSYRHTWWGTGDYLRWLKSNFDADYAACGHAVEQALDLIEQADEAVAKVGPALPSPERVRDHV